MEPTQVRPPRTATEAGAEARRLKEDTARDRNWKRWGPYLSERQWGTVREDYSAHGQAWDSFPHDHARSRAYRWGEDGLLGITDREGRMNFALALWNGADPILKERLFGLTGSEGNHGEDVKEEYFYLDSTPTHSYMKALYKYPQTAYPYARLVEENRRRGKDEPEFELVDTGAFADDRYFDVFVEYAKEAPNDLLVRITVENRGPDAAMLEVLPTLWFRNTWSWGRQGEGYAAKPRLVAEPDVEERAGARGAAAALRAEHATLGTFRLVADRAEVGGRPGPEPTLLFTENETNVARLYQVDNATPYVKDAFHAAVVDGRADAVNPAQVGTKAAVRYRLEVPARGRAVVRLRLFSEEDAPREPFGASFERARAARVAEADAFYDAILEPEMTAEERRVARQAYSGLLWSKQFYHYDVKAWLAGDPAQPAPPDGRTRGRNAEWPHLYNRDILSMPDKWEYPWYAAWDLAFHMVPMAKVDPHFAKEQLVLLLREWYMHPNGQIPAYEWAFGDVNPPVHAWAVWRVYKMTGTKGRRDRLFLARCFQKLLLNFTWWVNRKDTEGRNVFAGGFLGLDNIGVFDRSAPLPTGGHLEQADGTAWMAFYCATMLSMALELASEDKAYADVASKFFEHFVAIVDAMNGMGDEGLWDEADGIYYDQLHANGRRQPLRVRSLVGLLPLIACEILEPDVVNALPGFKKRLEWFLENRADLARHISWYQCAGEDAEHGHRLLAVPSRERLERVLRLLFDESEFLSSHGIRSVSQAHRDRPYVLPVNGHEHRVDYAPGESTTGLFGGNSNWRGPVWFPVNYLIVEALERYHHFYGDSLLVECPTGSGHRVTLDEAAGELARRLAAIFLQGGDGQRPFSGRDARFAEHPHWRELVLFHEYFHGDTGRGLGASHQTGWTALAARLVEDGARRRGRAAARAAPAPAPAARNGASPVAAAAAERP